MMMEKENQVFLNTIIANPDDDAPRWVYADWLDEQGYYERAEFIRLQCRGTSPVSTHRLPGELFKLLRGGWCELSKVFPEERRYQSQEDVYHDVEQACYHHARSRLSFLSKGVINTK